MARLVLASAGAAVGGFFGGTVGAQVGWALGSMVGGTFEPNQKSAGPRLNDLSVSGSSYGTAIPYVVGSPRVAGQIVWASAKREIATTQTQGKGGGGGQEYTSYTYEVDLLILLTDNIIQGITRVWSNGELIYSTNSTAITTLLASNSTSRWARLTPYTGAATQLPDPTYEAAVGTVNAPAYRGRGSVFIQGLQLGSSGQLPNLTFEVCTATTAGSVNAVFGNFDNALQNSKTSSFTSSSSGLVLAGSTVAGSPGVVSFQRIDFGTSRENLTSYAQSGFLYSGVGGYSDVPIYLDVSADIKVFSQTGQLLHAIPSADAPNRYCKVGNVIWCCRQGTNLLTRYQNSVKTATVSIAFNVQSMVLIGSNLVVHLASESQFRQYDSVTLTAGTTIATPTGLSNQNTLLLRGENGVLYCAGADLAIKQLHAYVNGAWVLINSDIGSASPNISAFGSLTSQSVVFKNSIFTVKPSLSGSDGLAATYASTPTVVAAPETLQTVVARLCALAGLSAAQYDTTALAAITRPVRALSVASVSNVRNMLEVLASAFQFEAVLSDKIYFRPRAGAVQGSVPFEDMGCDGGEPIAMRMVNELEVPAQMAISYSNVDNDYQVDTQYSDRLLTGQESTSATQLPLALTATEAKALADGLLTDKFIGMTSTTVAVGTQYARFEPTDVITVADEDANGWRMRIAKKTEAAGVIKFDLVMDDATVFTQVGTTSAGTLGQSVVNTPAASSLLLLDIPLLQDADNGPGHYAAIKGNGAGWQSAALFSSSVDNSYVQNQTVFNTATFGTTSTTLPSYSGPAVFDEVSTVTVNVGSTGQLASATRDAVLNSQTVNAALIGSEVVQYRTATLVSAGVYTLSGFLRGRRGTEWAMTVHTTGENFCVLGVAGMMLVPLQSADLGKLWYYKAASAGQALSAVTAKTITPTGVLLKPFAPTNCRVNRVTTDTAITWTRRTRLAPRFVGTLGINTPLGETTEAYEVEVYSSNTFITLRRTITGLTTPAATYTSAQQVTDFGANQSVLYLRIYQLSATVGRGYSLQVTI
jgi:hypothetical protein